MTPPLHFQDLGRDRDFAEIWDLQEKMVRQRRAGAIEDTILLLEHAPVFTIGRTRDQSSLREPGRLPHPVVEINRGGQATYHGPGQLVGYAILDLSQRTKDLHRHLRHLEEALIRTLARFDITAGRREGLTGVWVGERKIASLGVGVRSWVTLHGFALNVLESSLPPFSAITPCGLDGVAMTCAAQESTRPVTIPAVKKAMTRDLADVFRQEN